MGIQHLEALKHKHDLLEEKIRQEQQRPAPDVARLSDLKKQKLRLKEEITH